MDNEIGKKYNKLTIVEKLYKDNHNTWIYQCQCDCGNFKEVNINRLRTGHVKSCGCLNHRIKDLTDQRFGRLLVLEFVERKNKKTMWRCQCDCGNVCIAESHSLQTGGIVSCGCRNKENQKQIVYKDKGLREGTRVSSISGNRKVNRNNSSGITGVHFDKTRNKWVAQITFQRKNYPLGRYETKEEAIQARLDGEEKYFGKYRK